MLLANAHAHGAGAVTLTMRSHGDWLALDVADEGAGFAGDPERAFARRTGVHATLAATTGPQVAERPGTEGGHGIGLALARSLAHAESGRLVLSRPGPSPVFTLWLSSAPPRAG